MLQFEDVHGLRVAGSTEELGIHAEHQGADVHIPRAKQGQDWSLHGNSFKLLGLAHREVDGEGGDPSMVRIILHSCC